VLRFDPHSSLRVHCLVFTFEPPVMPEQNNDLTSPLTDSFDAAHVLESISDAFFALDTDWRFIYINDQSARLMARTREELTGKRFWDEFPDTLGSPFEQHYV